MGANDPINEISKICKKFNLWLHLDGHWWFNNILKKIQTFSKWNPTLDSFCFNPHKTLGTPLSTSVFIVKNKQDLYNSFNQKSPDYLYQTEDNDYNLGQMSFECGRRNNIKILDSMEV